MQTNKDNQDADATAGESRVYVGTYAKYNSGSIAGKWLDLSDYSDKDEFLAACAELHKDESDPELMFQDHEGIPEGMISESSIEAEVWDWLALNDTAKELLAVYRAEVDSDGTIEQANEAFAGAWSSPEDWAENFMEDTGGLSEMPENLRMYFDFEAYARDARLNGDIHFVEHNGETWAFYNR